MRALLRPHAPPAPTPDPDIVLDLQTVLVSPTRLAAITWQMHRCSCRQWIPLWPWPIWPLAWPCPLGQKVVVGSMTIRRVVGRNIATSSMSGPPFAVQLHRIPVWCGATNSLLRW